MKFKIILAFCICGFFTIIMSSFSIFKNSFFSTLTPYKLEIPENFFDMKIPMDNPLTVEGVELGRKLFYEPLLSGNNKISCGTCHQQKYAFADSSVAFSRGVDGVKGNRNTMTLFNLGWSNRGLFWDGRSANLESQVIEPIKNPAEMHESLENAVGKLQKSKVYRSLFKKAFGSKTITSKMIMYAIAQFERTIISSNSRYDKFVRKEKGGYLTAIELKGLNLFSSSEKGECFSCHLLNGLLTSFTYNNIGLEYIAKDSGRYNVNFSCNEIGAFKTPSLRNIALTAPYMHDGRFQTLDQVMDHYNDGFKYSPNLDRIIYKRVKGNLSVEEKKCIIEFMKTLTDSVLISDPKYSNPN
ncbi:MAG: cytochrome c peroxidase [Bacteroidia bacterium]